MSSLTDAESSITSSHIEHVHMSNFGASFRAPSSRCYQCTARPKENGKNLVVCIDGTSNQFGDHNTNVLKLFTKIDLTTTLPEQLAYYSSGIGTGPKSSNIFNRMGRTIFDKLDMAVAWNIEEIVKETYSWLARVYQEGDQIYLFGFSRGAYQVRVLASMIHEVGLIRTQTEKQIKRAYDYYEATHSGSPEPRHMARKFKSTFSWVGVRVHFIGVWDTVSSVGLVRGNNFLSASSCAEHACHFRHALALDELRVKFMPEYIREVNSRTNDGKSRYIVTSVGIEHAASPESEWRKSTMNDKATDLSGGKDKTADIKEVWFAGSHSDVGGTERSGKSHYAGNVPLLWMRREATESGLKLQPTDIVWVPDDIDIGTSDAMARLWQLIEYMPITHQVSFSGPGDNARRLHRLQPRRIIPGQKLHASILYANAYNPHASLGEGFDIPIIDLGPDVELDSRIWETGLFDDTAAQELIAYLGGPQGVVPIYLDRLLFMLRFKEGRQCVRNVPGWQRQFLNLIRNPDCAPFVRLGSTVAYYEASCDPDIHLGSLALPQAHIELSEEMFDDAKKSLIDILAASNYRDGPRVVALLRPLTKRPFLQQHILTHDVLETLMNLLDALIERAGGNFGQVMDYFTCLLQCEGTREIIIGKLETKPPFADVARISWILEVQDLSLLTAALRMVKTLARIPAAIPVCSIVKPRLRQLAQKDKLVGLLSVEILLALYDPIEPEQLNIRSAKVRENLAGALVRLSPDRYEAANEGCGADRKRVLQRLFGLDAAQLYEGQKMLIRELNRAIWNGDARERTNATLTVLKLCEGETIRAFLCEIGLLDVLIMQLRRKDKALLAAYALAICLKHGDLKESIKDNEHLPKNIVGMLQLDYFDDAIGQIEGFQVFGDFMQHDDLREKIKNYNITEVLHRKLAKGRQKEIRTSLIFLDIFRSFDEDGPWTKELVAKSLVYLRAPDWHVQKIGVTILSALVQTEHGVAAISPKIYEIVQMLLPEGYSQIQLTAPAIRGDGASTSNEVQAQPVATAQWSAIPFSPPTDALFRPLSWMMGPACALRILAQNEKLRNDTRSTSEYGIVKYLYLSGTLISTTDTSPWRVKTPNYADIVHVVERMIKVVDGEILEEGLMSVGNAVLPHIKHWDRLGKLLSDRAVATITILPALLGVSALAILAVVAAPVYLSVRAVGLMKKIVGHYRDSVILEKLRGVHIPDVHAHGAVRLDREGESDSSFGAGEHNGEGASDST